jgi:hypothetical protein
VSYGRIIQIEDTDIAVSPFTLKSFLGVIITFVCKTIDLVSIDQQRVGKRSRHLMDTVNAKKRWTTIYWRLNVYFASTQWEREVSI